MGKSETELSEQLEATRRGYAADPECDQDPPGFSEVASRLALRDYWTISEAANVLCRCHPNRPSDLPGHDALDEQIANLREALRRSDSAKGAPNGDMSLMDAQEVCGWARSKGIALPEPLERQFLDDADQSESTATEPTREHGNAPRFRGQREAVLQAALAVVMRYHHQCLGPNGKVSAKKVVELIEANQTALFEGELPQGSDTMEKHVCVARNLLNAGP